VKEDLSFQLVRCDTSAHQLLIQCVAELFLNSSVGKAHRWVKYKQRSGIDLNLWHLSLGASGLAFLVSAL
jgi:hypothetical protein